MDNQTFKAIQEAKDQLKPILDKWRVRLSFNSISRIEQVINDTTLDGINETIPGTISSIHTPIEYLEISTWQREENEFLIAAPYTPKIEIRKPNYSTVKFFANMLALVFADGPDEQDWKEAESNENAKRQEDAQLSF